MLLTQAVQVSILKHPVTKEQTTVCFVPIRDTILLLSNTEPNTTIHNTIYTTHGCYTKSLLRTLLGPDRDSNRLLSNSGKEACGYHS